LAKIVVAFVPGDGGRGVRFAPDSLLEETGFEPSIPSGLALLPDTPERQRQELEFTSALGAALMVVKGFAAPETGHAYARARVLWEQLGSPSEFLQVPHGQSLYHAGRGELDLALCLDEEMLRMSRQRKDSAALMVGIGTVRNFAKLRAQVALYLEPDDLWLAHLRSLLAQVEMHRGRCAGLEI
jgi:hypothetical protein